MTINRTVAGLKLTKEAPGPRQPWRTLDGRFEFTPDYGFMVADTEAEHKRADVHGVFTVEEWSAWDNQANDHAFNGETGYDTLTEAVEWVKQGLAKEGS